jgi:hypothetical protein
MSGVSGGGRNGNGLIRTPAASFSATTKLRTSATP